jgi:hypothetical protein
MLLSLLYAPDSVDTFLHLAKHAFRNCTVVSNSNGDGYDFDHPCGREVTAREGTEGVRTMERTNYLLHCLLSRRPFSNRCHPTQYLTPIRELELDNRRHNS